MKKTLIIIGSARKDGHTASIVQEFKKNLIGEVEIIDTYRLKNISPCLDCRICWKTPNCCITDDMSDIYRKMESADNFIFASAVYFHSVPAPMKIVIDRCQVYWAAHVRKDKNPIRKKALLALVGGAPNFKNQFLGAEIVLKGLAEALESKVIGSIYLANSDRVSLDDFPEIKEEIRKYSEELNAQ
ncbi:MAG: flavodoxin family protein [Fusobacteriaceae bacterium]